MEKWLKFLSSHSVQRHRSTNFTPAFFLDVKIWNLCSLKGNLGSLLQICHGNFLMS